jgi:demethylmenaquinone methyltransferase/2-methoxy-6-polyprenyl-1,4-benzoquinol methylase
MRCSQSSDVGRLFDRIAPTYDLLNHLLSVGRDFSWRRKAARQLGSAAGFKVIDLAAGTGDMLIALLRERPDIAEATGLDISGNMLDLCRAKLCRGSLEDHVSLLCADAAATSLPDDQFDAATMAFGIRNTPDAAATLKEIHRILKPGGMAVILEFSLPACPGVRWFYLRYLRYVVPLLGAVVSGDRRAYRYLDESIESFLQPAEFTCLMDAAGFREITVVPLTFAVATIYKGTKA